MNFFKSQILLSLVGLVLASVSFAQVQDSQGLDIAVVRAVINKQHIAMDPSAKADFTIDVSKCDITNRQPIASGGRTMYDSVTLDCTREASRVLGMPMLGKYISYSAQAGADGGPVTVGTLVGQTCRFAEIDAVIAKDALANANGVGFNGQFGYSGGDTFTKKEDLVAVQTRSGDQASATLSANGKSAGVYRFGAIIGCASEQAFARMEFKPYLDYEPSGSIRYHVWETFSGNHSLQITQNEAWSVRSLVSSTNLDDSFFATPIADQGDSQIFNGHGSFGTYVDYTIENRDGKNTMSWGTPGGQFATLNSGSFVTLIANPNQGNRGIEVNYKASQAVRPQGVSDRPSPYNLPTGFTLELDYQVNGAAPKSAQNLTGGSCFGDLDKCFQLPLATEAGVVTYSFKWTNTQTGQVSIDDNQGSKYSFVAVAPAQTTITVNHDGSVQASAPITAGSAFSINYDANYALHLLRQAGIQPNAVKITAAVSFAGSSNSNVNIPLRMLSPQNSGSSIPNFSDAISGVIPVAVPAGTTSLQVKIVIENTVYGSAHGSVVDSGTQLNFDVK